MNDVLAGLPIGNISAGALVALVVLLILRGNLVPRQQLLDMREDRDTWRTSSEEWQRIATRTSISVERLVVLAEASNHALTEIQALGRRSEPEQATS